MLSNICNDEMEKMFKGFERQATESLRFIGQKSEAEGWPFDEDIRQDILKITNDRLSAVYSAIQFELRLRKRQATVGEFQDRGLISHNQSIGSDRSDDLASSYTEVPNIASEVPVKVETEIELKQEEIAENIPTVTFNPMETDSFEGSSKNISGSIDTSKSSQPRPKSKQKNVAKIKVKSNDRKSTGSKSAKNLKCHICEYVTRYKNHLNNHLLTHTDDKPYRCECCSKCFKQSCNLKVHKKIHKDEFPFNCSRCFNGFKQEHEKDTHEEKCKVRSYECYFCKEFVTNNKSKLRKHMRCHRGNEPYRCIRGHCCQRFITFSKFKSHLELHKKIPYYCYGCSRKFMQKNELETHKEICDIHLFECDVCKKYKTNHKSNLRRHMRTHT